MRQCIRTVKLTRHQRRGSTKGGELSRVETSDESPGVAGVCKSGIGSSQFSKWNLFLSYRASCSDTNRPMNKHQLIDAIRKFNPTAQPEFLAQFDEDALKHYLDHLQEAQNKHLRYSRIPTATHNTFRKVS